MATKQDPTTPKRRRPPARTPAARTNQLIAQCLKLDPAREELERVRLANENELLKARVAALESGQRVEELYAEALEAMKAYRGEDADV